MRVVHPAAALALIAASFGQPTREPPLVLPPVTVGAGLPITKVAEHRLVTPRWGSAAVVHGDYIYIIGGNSGLFGGGEDSIERFNVRTLVAEYFARLPAPRLWHRAVVSGDSIYVIGGCPPWAKNQFVAEESVEIVDIITGTVARGPSMPEKRHSFACVRVDGKIYVIGGLRYDGQRAVATNTVLVFDLARGVWSRGVPMFTPRQSEAVLVDGGFIIVPGGYDGRNARNEVEVFNPRTNIWSKLPPLCRPTGANSLVFFGQHLILFGDYDSPHELIAYDLVRKRSDIFTVRYAPARHTAAVVHEGKIYVVGGRSSAGSMPLSVIQVFAPTSSPN